MEVINYGTPIGTDLRSEVQLPEASEGLDVSALRGKYKPAPEVHPEPPTMEKPSWFASMGAAFDLTVTKALYNSYEAMQFEPVPNYDYMQDVKASELALGVAMDKEQIEFMKSDSPAEFQHKQQVWDETKFAEQTAAEHITALFAGVVAFDPVAMLGGMAGAKAAMVGAKAAQLSATGARLAGVAAGAVTEGSMAAAASTGTPMDDEIVMYAAIGGALGGLFVDVKNFPKYKHNPNSVLSKVKIPQTVKNFQSLYDEVASVSKEYANAFFGDFTRNSGHSASAFARNIQADQGRMLIPFEQVMKKHGLVPGFSIGKNRAAIRVQREAKMKEANLWLHRQYQEDRLGNGVMLPSHPDPIVREMVEAYAESGFALSYIDRAQQAGKNVHSRMTAKEHDKLVQKYGTQWFDENTSAIPNQTVTAAERQAIIREQGELIVQKIIDNNFTKGMDGTAGITRSKHYVPLQHDYNKIRRLIDRIGVESVAEAYGRQLLKNIPEELRDIELIRNVGAGFLEIAQGGKKGDAAVKDYIKARKATEIQGMKDAMLDVGLDTYTVERILGKGLDVDPATAIGQTATHLRTRFDWDLDEVLDARTGETFGDMLSDDMYGNLNRYNMQMSNRIGLAQMGFKNGASLNSAFNDMVDTAVTKGMARTKAVELGDHVADVMLGQGVGENISEGWRNLTAVAQMIHLAKSGIYNLADYAVVAWDQGVLRTAKAFIKTLPQDALKNLTKQEAETLADIVSGRIIADGRIRPMVTLFEDNFDCIDNGFTEGVQYAGQYVRFLNGSESIRRHQARMYGALIMDTIDKDFKATGGKYLAELGMPAEDITKVQQAIGAYGWDMNRWDLSVSDKLSNYALSAADNTVLSIRKGERPRVMDSSYGKVLFAYQSFVFGAHNKILRRAMRKDGVTGVATLLALQLPLATVAAMAANIVDGKDPEDNLSTNIVKSMSTLGLFGWLHSNLDRAELGSSLTSIAPINAVGKVGTKAASGTLEPIDVVKATPMLAVLPPLRMLVSNVPD